MWETVGNTGKKGGALNQAWDRLDDYLTDDDYLVTMDADTLLDEHFVENAYAKYQQKRRKGHKLGGVCANFQGLELDSALGVLQKMEYARAEKINRSRRGIAPVLAGAATMFSVRALREVHESRGRLYEPVLTEDYELSLALRVHGYETMAPRNCLAHTDLMPTAKMLWAQRLRWYRGAFESLRDYGFRKHIRSDIGWLDLLPVGRRVALAVPGRSGRRALHGRAYDVLALAAPPLRLRLLHPHGAGEGARLEVRPARGRDGRRALLRILPRGRSVAIGLPGVLRQEQRKVVNRMFPTSPSVFASTAILVVGAVLTRASS